MKLITEFATLGDQVNYDIVEEVAGHKKYYIQGIFLQSEIQNKNGRRYPRHILEKEVKRYNNEYIMQNRAYGELGHPSGPSINLDRVCHIIRELYQDGNNFIGKAEILNTEYGKTVQAILDAGGKLGVSSRGVGTLKKEGNVNLVQDDFMLATAADIVADPSAPSAFVNGIMEGKEWVWNNGILEESVVNEIKTEILKPKTNIKGIKRVINEESAIDAFSKFLTGIKIKF